MHPGGTREGRGSWQLEPPTEKLLSRLPHSPCPDGKSGGPWKEWEGEQWRREQAEVTGCFVAGRGDKRRGGWKVTEVVLFWKLCLFIPYSSHTSPPCLNWRKSGNIMTYRQRERWAKSKCTLKCSLYPLCLVLGFWEKSPYSRGEWEERTYCMLEIEFFV